MTNFSRPDKFVPAEGVLWAKLLAGQPAFIKRRRARGAKARGVSYERKAHEYLRECIIGLPKAEYKQGPWIEFQDKTGRRWCQPDGLLINQSEQHLIIAEIKYRHCAEAWWQLWRLYMPVVRKIFEGFTCGALELCRWYDPQTRFPAEIIFTPNPLQIPSAALTAVHIWNPQRG